MRVVNAPYLQAKKLYARDKRHANTLMTESVQQFGTDLGWKIDEATATRIVIDKETRRHAAYLAYGHWLIERLAGKSDGPAILALWRLIAWEPRGGMRPGFTLQLADFKIAEQTIQAAILSAG